jgi:hypothetical protein
MATTMAFAKGTFGEADGQSLYEATAANIDAVRKGSMNGPEALLVAQATSLNMIYTELARRSALNMGEYIEASERYMRLALKAQSQCRATIETLAALKNPPVVYARQANISAGHQQINNHPAQPSPAAKIETSHNELLEVKDGERLEPRTQSSAERGDMSVETMAASGGPHKSCRQAALKQKRRQGI